MPTTEQQVKNIIAKNKDQVSKHQIARELGISLDYLNLVAQALKKKGEIIISKGRFSLPKLILWSKKKKQKSQAIRRKSSQQSSLAIPKIRKNAKRQVKTRKKTQSKFGTAKSDRVRTQRKTSKKTRSHKSSSKKPPTRKASLSDLLIVSKQLVDIIEKAGYKTVGAVANAPLAKLMQQTNLKLREAAGLINKARKKLSLIVIILLLLFSFMTGIVLAKGKASGIDMPAEVDTIRSERENVDTLLPGIDESRSVLDTQEIAFGDDSETILEHGKQVRLPKSSEIEPKQLMKINVIVTFYSSTSDQTDDTPFITANGTLVRDGIAAANFLRLGTHIKLPELYGDKVFIIADRMHPRFTDRLDVWVKTRQEALKKGIHYTTLEIY